MRSAPTAALAACLAALAALPLAGRADDKSSTRPNVISVPKGPGSLTGLGESFEANLNSGSARETVKLELPPGTAGMAPSLALTYDSGFGNGPLGIGWSLGLSAIQVQTEKGLPRYQGADRFRLDGAELVPVSAGVYRPKLEGRFVRVRRSGDHWEVDSPDGKTLRYGVSPEGRASSSDGARVYSWALEDVLDRYGNRIGYFYELRGGRPRLVEIQYDRRSGAADNRIVFEYEPRPDVTTDCRPGFCVELAQRLRVVSAFARGQLVRRWRLDYDEANGVSLLSAVTQYGNDGVSALPAVRFWYSPFAAKGQARAVQSAPAYLPGPGSSGNDELVDLDGDGFPDLLHAETGSHWYYLNQGGLRFGARVDMPWSPSVALGSSGVEVADLDGDGLADLIAKSGTTPSGFRYFPNDPSQGVGQWQSSVTFTNSPGFGFEDPNVRLLDFDHDKLIDAVQFVSSGTTSSLHLWRNRGDGSWEGPITVDLPSSVPAAGFADPKLKLSDMNGDRLLDLVYARTGSVIYWPNLGWGRFGDPVEVGNAPDPGTRAEASLMLADMNGDGLADLVWVDADHVDIWPLLPSGAFGAKITIADTPHYDTTYTVIRLADMNGNGSTDIVWSTPSAAVAQRIQYLDVVGDLRPNLLVAVENGMGKTLQIRYTSTGAAFQEARESGQPWATRVPFPVQVVAESILLDGLGHQYVTGYRYRDGWYAAETREFRGFAQAVTTELGDTNEATAVRVHQFDLGQTGEVRKGLPLVTEVRTETGALLQRETYVYSVRSYATGTDGTPVTGAEKGRHEVEHWEETSSPVVTREEWTYDEYQSVLVHSEWGIVEGTHLLAGKDERITTSTYASDTSSWLLGRVTQRTVADAAGTVLADSRTYYDGDPFVGLPLGQLGAAGMATRTEAWVEGSRWVEQQRVQRDEYGLVVARLDPMGTRREIDYDPETHCFPVAERVIYGSRVLAFGADYDLVLGVIRAYRDPVGAETRFTWDPLGHLTAIAKPGDTEAMPSTSFEYRYGNPRSEVVTRSRVRSGESEVIEKHAWYDGLGRQLGAVEQAENGKTLVSGAKDFGIQGRVIREYEPFFSSGYDLPLAGSAVTLHQYDPLGRRVRTVLSDGSRVEHRFLPLAVEHWDAEDLDPASLHANTPRTERLSGLGVVQVDERLGTRTLVTRFDRDALGRVSAVTDSQENLSAWSRDGLGRVFARVHPDAGQTLFTYDDLGNVVSQIDARGASVFTEYDELGRPFLQRLVDPAGIEEERVRYHYDDPSPLFPGDVATGELAWVEDGAGEEHYRRDERGRLVEFVRKVDGREYRIATAYDGLDRITHVVYPSGRASDLAYNPRSLLESVPGIVHSIEYGPQGLATRREHGNGSVSTAAYDSMDRVVSLETTTRGRTVQSLVYGYDRVGSLIRIDDALRSSGALAAGRQYGYDDLYRLTVGTGADRSWTYAFSDSGNLISKSGVGEYAPGKGHQVASAGGQGYVHDASGNVVERPGSKLRYDAKGRLRRVDMTDGTVVSYRYDHSGRRVVKESTGPEGNHRTVYVDRTSEERDGQLVDYVFAGDVRVARLGGERPTPVALAGLVNSLPPALGAAALILLALGAASAMARALRRRARALVSLGTACALLAMTMNGCNCAGNAPATGTIAASAYYHGDHLAGVALQTDERGEVVAEVAYDPYGGQLAASNEPYGFTGKEFEANTGLYDFGARAYDPVLGRFLSPDPATLADPEIGLSDPQLLNPYAYARNAPTGHVDPDGKLPHIVAGALAGGAIGGGIYLVKAAVTGEFSARSLGASVAGGAIAGGVAAATCGASLVVQGTAAGFAGGIAQRGIETGSLSKTFDPRAMAVDTALGAAAGPAAKLAGKGLGAVAQRAAPAVNTMVVRAGGAIGSAQGRTAVGGPIWSATKSKTAVQNAFGHWKKHGAEFPEFRNAKEYVEGAQRFVNQPPQGLLSKVRSNGDTVLYDSASNTFGVRAADGAPRTMFRPDPAQHGYPTNLDYFNAQ